MKPTIDEELIAVREIARRVAIHHAPDAPALVEALHPGATIFSELGSTEMTPGATDFVVCMIVRDRKRFPDNKTGQCADCREPIEFRPYIPDGPTKLCALCALRQVRGDA